MNKRMLGSLEVSAIGLGCMGMSEFYGERRRAPSRIATLHRALELGRQLPRHRRHVRPVHQRGAGRPGHRGRRDEVVLATKFGNVRDADGAASSASAAGPSTCARACDASLQRLGVDHIDLYYQHRVDPKVPIEETVGAMAELVQAGKVRYLGPVRGRAGDHPPRARRPPDHRAADRVLAVDPRRRRTRSCRPCASSASASSPTARSAAASSPAASSSSEDLAGGRLPPQQPALPGRELRAEPRAGRRGSKEIADAKGVHRRPARAGLGAGPGRRHRADPRHQARASTSRRTSGAAEIELSDDDLRRLDEAAPAGRRRGHALRRGADGDRGPLALVDRSDHRGEVLAAEALRVRHGVAGLGAPATSKSEPRSRASDRQWRTSLSMCSSLNSGSKSPSRIGPALSSSMAELPEPEPTTCSHRVEVHAGGLSQRDPLGERRRVHRGQGVVDQLHHRAVRRGGRRGRPARPSPRTAAGRARGRRRRRRP